MTALLDAAISYADDGLLVLPLHWPLGHGCSCRKPGCEHPGKHPLGPAVPNGKDSATRDVDQIRTWWKRWPSANIGIRPAPGMACSTSTRATTGTRRSHELQVTHGGLPETLTATTGSGGAHVWYAAPKVTVGKLGAGIDVKTERGYLVAAPSVHASGGVYRWTSEAPIVEAPRWLQNLLAPPRPVVLRTLGPQRWRRAATVARRWCAPSRPPRRATATTCCGGPRGRPTRSRAATRELLDEIRQAAIAGGQTATAVDATIRSAERWVRSGGRR